MCWTARGRNWRDGKRRNPPKEREEQMSKTDLPALAGTGAPLVQEVKQAMTGFVNEFKGFQDDMKSKLQQQEERMNMLDRKSLNAARPHLAAHVETGAPHQKAFDAVTPVMEIMSWIPDLKTELINSSCCGMAGAFGYQDGNDWLTVIEGSESNVVGLPMERLAELLENFDSKSETVDTERFVPPMDSL